MLFIVVFTVLAQNPFCCDLRTIGAKNNQKSCLWSKDDKYDVSLQLFIETMNIQIIKSKVFIQKRFSLQNPESFDENIHFFNF